MMRARRRGGWVVLGRRSGRRTGEARPTGTCFRGARHPGRDSRRRRGRGGSSPPPRAILRGRTAVGQRTRIRSSGRRASAARSNHRPMPVRAPWMARAIHTGSNPDFFRHGSTGHRRGFPSWLLSGVVGGEGQTRGSAALRWSCRAWVKAAPAVPQAVKRVAAREAEALRRCPSLFRRVERGEERLAVHPGAG